MQHFANICFFDLFRLCPRLPTVSDQFWKALAMAVADLSTKTNDVDTLGGRLSRARDAKNSSVDQVAGLVGVEAKTLKAWESDQAAPRANRLSMLAGALGISQSWLLFGRGTSPKEKSTSANVESIKHQLNQLKVEQQKINTEIKILEDSLRKISAK